MKLSNPNISRSAILVEGASNVTLKMHRIHEFNHSLIELISLNGDRTNSAARIADSGCAYAQLCHNRDAKCRMKACTVEEIREKRKTALSYSTHPEFSAAKLVHRLMLHADTFNRPARLL